MKGPEQAPEYLGELQPSGKFQFRRLRSKEAKVTEEIWCKGKWRSRGKADKNFRGDVRFKIIGLYVAGKRVRRYFSTRAEAETLIQTHQTRIENLGARARHVDSRLVDDAVECEALLKPYGMRLLDAMRDYANSRKLLVKYPDASLTDAASHFSAVLADRLRSWTVGEAAEAWIASRKRLGKSAAYLFDIERRLKPFRAHFGTTSMADIEPAQIEHWLEAVGDLGPQSVRNYLTVLSGMFNFGVKHGRSPRNPVALIERPKVVRGDPVIFTPAELNLLLAHLPADTVPYVALGAFAGLRPTEARRLQWEDVKFATRQIAVRTGTAKTNRRRTTPMSDNLAQWLQPHAKETGNVVPLPEYTIRQHRLKAAVKKAKIEKCMPEWPQDILRHSASTYLLEREGDDARVAMWLGHSRETMHAHYKALLTDPKHAAEWFTIMPSS